MNPPSATSGAATRSSSLSYLRGVSSFILRLVNDSLLFVNERELLFGNRAFEDLCGHAFSKLRSSPSLLLSPDELASFLRLVGMHLAGERTHSLNHHVEASRNVEGLQS